MSKARMRLWAFLWSICCAGLPVALLTVASRACAQGAPDYTRGDIISVVIIGIGALLAVLGFVSGRQR